MGKLKLIYTVPYPDIYLDGLINHQVYYKLPDVRGGSFSLARSFWIKSNFEFEIIDLKPKISMHTIQNR
jgi:hypothetical protein